MPNSRKQGSGSARNAGLPKLTEKQFMAQVKQLATMMKWSYYHPYDSRRSAPGFPDLVLVRPPRTIFVELKIEDGFLTPDQQRWQQLLCECPGVRYHLWRPCDWPEIEKVLGVKVETKEEFDSRCYGGSGYTVRDLLW